MQPAGAAHIFAGAPPEFLKAFGADRAAMTPALRAPDRRRRARAAAALPRLARGACSRDGRRYLLGSAAERSPTSRSRSRSGSCAARRRSRRCSAPYPRHRRLVRARARRSATASRRRSTSADAIALAAGTHGACGDVGERGRRLRAPATRHRHADRLRARRDRGHARRPRRRRGRRRARRRARRPRPRPLPAHRLPGQGGRRRNSHEDIQGRHRRHHRRRLGLRPRDRRASPRSAA